MMSSELMCTTVFDCSRGVSLAKFNNLLVVLVNNIAQRVSDTGSEHFVYTSQKKFHIPEEGIAGSLI